MVEYLTVVVGDAHTAEPKIKSIAGEPVEDWQNYSLQQGLDDLGEEDWDLIAIHWSPRGDADPIYIFSRYVEDDFEEYDEYLEYEDEEENRDDGADEEEEEEEEEENEENEEPERRSRFVGKSGR
jgi:TATA-binding protein-associated factor Taf7